MSDVLVDSSVWIDFFRGRPEAVRRVDPLLADDRAATTPIVTAEVASGAKTRDVFDELGRRFAGLTSLAEPARVWPRAAELRFALARRGFQAHLLDLAIALTAFDAAHRLMTRDRDFAAIAEVVPLEVDLF